MINILVVSRDIPDVQFKFCRADNPTRKKCIPLQIVH